MNTRDFLTLLLVSLFWGGSFLFLRLLVLEGLEPLQIVSLRMMFAAVFIAPFFLNKLKKHSFHDHGFPILLIGLLKYISSGIEDGIKNFSIFEIGKVFIKDADTIKEKMHLCIVRLGDAIKKDALSVERNFDFYDIKNDTIDILNSFNIQDRDIRIKKTNDTTYHSFNSADIYIKKDIILNQFIYCCSNNGRIHHININISYFYYHIEYK